MISDLLYHLSNPGSIPPMGWAILLSGTALIVTFGALLFAVFADPTRGKT